MFVASKCRLLDDLTAGGCLRGSLTTRAPRAPALLLGVRRFWAPGSGVPSMGNRRHEQDSQQRPCRGDWRTIRLGDELLGHHEGVSPAFSRTPGTIEGEQNAAGSPQRPSGHENRAHAGKRPARVQRAPTRLYGDTNSNVGSGSACLENPERGRAVIMQRWLPCHGATNLAGGRVKTHPGGSAGIVRTEVRCVQIFNTPSVRKTLPNFAA